MNKKNKKIDPEIKKLVIWRIETSVPKNFKLSMGDKGTFDKDDLKKHVEAEDEIGIRIINMQLQFIKDLSTGKLSKMLVE